MPGGCSLCLGLVVRSGPSTHPAVRRSGGARRRICRALDARGQAFGFKVGLVVGCSLAGLALLIVARRLSGWGPISAAIGATLGAWLVAAFSGSQGAAGSYPGWLEALFGLDPATAEAVSTLSRKVVHFVFYGTFGLLHLLALSHMGRREAVGASWVVVVEPRE